MEQTTYFEEYEIGAGRTTFGRTITEIGEGDTLVVESTGFNEITPGFGVHTEALKVTERYTRPQNDILLIEVIAEDPEAFTEIWTRNYEARLVEGQEILEFVCAEGNDTSLFAQPVWRGRP